jgi:hypothetical protein
MPARRRRINLLRRKAAMLFRRENRFGGETEAIAAD